MAKQTLISIPDPTGMPKQMVQDVFHLSEVCSRVETAKFLRLMGCRTHKIIDNPPKVCGTSFFENYCTATVSDKLLDVCLVTLIFLLNHIYISKFYDRMACTTLYAIERLY